MQPGCTVVVFPVVPDKDRNCAQRDVLGEEDQLRGQEKMMSKIRVEKVQINKADFSPINIRIGEVATRGLYFVPKHFLFNFRLLF